MNTHSIRFRLIGLYAGLLAPVMLLFGAYMQTRLDHFLRVVLRSTLEHRAEQIVRDILPAIPKRGESFQHVTRFIADASHELRTPLTVIHCELEAILRNRTLDTDFREALGRPLDEVVRLVRIVEGLFALSKLDTGEARIERVRFDLAKLAETTAEQMCLLAEEKRIQLVCAIREQTEVEGDRSRLKQVTVNLLDNAIIYTPADGKILLAVRAENGGALLGIADSGLGVSGSALPHLFKRFFRADEAHSREVEGAGLGLFIVHSICIAHGGSVSIRNVAPTGCQVTVQLPKAK